MTTHIPSLTLPSILFSNATASILLPIAAGTAIGFSTRPTETQNTYLQLRQPPFRPPPWVFGPAWTTLYGLMGYAAHRAWTTGMGSLNPRTVGLAKVRISVLLVSLFSSKCSWFVMLIVLGCKAWRYALYASARLEPHLDAALLRVETTRRCYCGYLGADGHGLVSGVCLGPGR